MDRLGRQNEYSTSPRALVSCWRTYEPNKRATPADSVSLDHVSSPCATPAVRAHLYRTGGGCAAESAGLGHGRLLGDYRAAALDELLQVVAAGALVMAAVGAVSGGAATLQLSAARLVPGGGGLR